MASCCAQAALASAQPARAYSTEAVWDCDSQQGLQARAQALSERAYNAIVRLKLKAGALSLAVCVCVRACMFVCMRACVCDVRA